jgi:predicted nucleotidyltransferase
MNVAESIMGSRSSIRVLRVLNGVSVALSITQIVQQAKMSRPAVIDVLDTLEQRGIVTVTRSGNARLYQIDNQNIYVQEVINPLFRIENGLRDEMCKDIKRVFEETASSAILFGSFARGDQTTESDVDVVIVADDDYQKQAVDDTLLDYSSYFYRRFGHALEAIVYDVREAEALIDRAPGLQAELAEDGRLIFGTKEWLKRG